MDCPEYGRVIGGDETLTEVPRRDGPSPYAIQILIGP